MPVYVWDRGRWRLADNGVYTYNTNPTGPPKRVIAAYLYQTNLAVNPPVKYGVQKELLGISTRHKIFDFTAPPPAVTGLVGTSPPTSDPNHHTRAILNWNAMPGAVGYKVYRHVPAPVYAADGKSFTQRGPVTVTTVEPSPKTATTYTFSGLSPGTGYMFWVTYVNEFGIESLVAKKIILNTGTAKVTATSLGYPGNPPADKYQALPASSSDTWTKSKQWGNSYQVTQGYLSNPADRGYGCINYHNGYGEVAKGLEALYVKTYGAGIGTAILDHLGVAAPENATIVDATFSRWTQLAGCAAGNNVYIYPANFSYGSGTTAPTTAGTSAYFDAPGPGNMKHNFKTIDGDGDNSHLILWATNLCKKVQLHNGLMIYRSDTTNTSGDGYAGYAKFQSKSDPNDTTYDLRINVWVKFSFTWKPYVAPKWS